MVMDSTAWHGGFASTFDGQLGQSNEDWEDWLRWDPSADAETTSPENTFSGAGSSKNDSPVQGTVWPTTDLGGLNGTVAPPMIAGEGGFRFANSFSGGEFAFGQAGGDATSAFDFGAVSLGAEDIGGMPKLDTSNSLWPVPMEIAPEDAALLSALSMDHSYTVPPTGPPTATTPDLQHSPESSTGKRTSLSSQDADRAPKKRGSRKRKAEVEQEADVNGESQGDGDEPPVKKTSHNVIEKRYRNNLNDKIVELRNSVPALRAMGRTKGGTDGEDLEGLAPAHKLNKATVMAKATEYIRHLEKRNNTMQDEMTALKARLASVEAAIKSRSRQASMGSVRPREMSNASQAGFLNVPTSVSQSQYMQQQSQPSYNRPPNSPVEAQNQPGVRNGRGGLINKVMLGSMAGLMAMEGYSESSGSPSDSSSRGLFAVPGMDRLVRRELSSPPSAGTLSSQAIIPLLKVILVLSALVYLIAPLLTLSSRKKQQVRPVIRLPQAPSLASPVEVRRKAWLTAVQSVWIPKHFLLEVVAVAAKMAKLSVRRLMGADMYSALTGMSREEEAARIKAWDIAIDAQLAGGDAEVSYYRLLLTLMASGTLPDSPTRLMQKAVHFRVFFWDVANAGYGDLIMFKQFTEKVGKIYWDSARKQQKELLHAKAQGRPTEEDEVDLLPDHLARLVELDCDEVLSDEMIQRAWNLAWNKPSAHSLDTNVARDSVVEDHAIRSPLDAVAAWYANILVDETLASALNPASSKLDTEYHLGLAVSIAPPGSATQARTLAAKAVLSSSNRDANILTALEALPAPALELTTTSANMNLVSHAPASPEVRTALTLAKLLTLSSATSPLPARQRAAQALQNLHTSPASFTLLTAVAGFKLMQVLAGDRDTIKQCGPELEDLACSLRIWAGTNAGIETGLGKLARGVLVDGCVTCVKRVGGWERDSGYGGSSRGASPAK